MSRPVDFKLPSEPNRFVGPPTDPVDERIEVGVLVVGGGPAGLACAVRFGQLLEEHPDVAERLGDVPLAVVEKGKQVGSHLLSGAVIRPGALERLFDGHGGLDGMPTFGTVEKEQVYVLARDRGLPILTPPPMRNHGNVVVSLSQLGRWLAERAEADGAMFLPETSAVTLLVDDGRVVGVRTGDKGRGLRDEQLANFEPGSDLVARVTVLAEGTQGHLTNVALDHFALRGDAAPQVWELGVKEIWKVPRPLDKVIHTMGWPLRPQAKYREFGGSFIYPMGDDLVSIGMVLGLDYRDPALNPHDLLQVLKTHPTVKPILEGGERIEWGAKTIPGGGFHALPRRLHAPGLLLCGDGVGMVNVPTLKGVHYAVESGRLAAEAAFAAVSQAADDAPVPDAALATYDDAVRDSFIWSELHQVRDLRQVFGRGFFVGGALGMINTITKGKVSVGSMTTEPDDDAPLLPVGDGASTPKIAHDGTLTFDRLTSVFASGNKTRDDQPNHLLVSTRVAPDVAELWANLCPAQVYTIGPKGDDGLVEVELSPSNCVQCGAIAAKGGRLTPPEGGSGPEYWQT
jgi:electron-transferring-flavoprotein dehydrogenase